MAPGWVRKTSALLGESRLESSGTEGREQGWEAVAVIQGCG